MHGELVFDIACWCCQPHRMAHGQHLNLKWIWMDAIIQFTTIRSLQNSAHATTAWLSWHVQNLVAITASEFEWDLDEISNEFELQWKNSLVRWATILHDLFLPWHSLLHLLDHSFLLLHQLCVANLHAMDLSLHGTDLALANFGVDGCSCFFCQLRLLLPKHDLASARNNGNEKLMSLYLWSDFLVPPQYKDAILPV